MISDASTTLPAIELTVELHADVPRVWRAITDPVELARWSPIGQTSCTARRQRHDVVRERRRVRRRGRGGRSGALPRLALGRGRRRGTRDDGDDARRVVAHAASRRRRNAARPQIWLRARRAP